MERLRMPIHTTGIYKHFKLVNYVNYVVILKATMKMVRLHQALQVVK
jgi:hypothetical protein